MARVNKNDMETISIARKYGLMPGTLKCEVFKLFEQGYSPREVRFLLRHLKIGIQDTSFSNTIYRYYYTWRQSQQNHPNKG